MFEDKFKLVKEQSNNVVTTKSIALVFSNIFSCEMKSSSSTKERNKTEILRFLVLFLKMWKMGEI